VGFMRKFQLLGAALVAVFSFGVLASSASAVNTFLLAEWLVGGHPVVSELLVEILGELLLEDNKVPVIGKSMVLCDGLFDGWVGPHSLDWISEVLDLENHAISNVDLSGLSLDCTPQTGCEANTLVLVWPFGLPKETEVELLEGDTPTPIFIVLIFGSIGYHITNCLVLGVPQEDLCVAEPNVNQGNSSAAAQLTLEGTTLLGMFSPAITALVGLENATCTTGGVNSGIVENPVGATFIPDTAEELTASSDELSA
jgi:hypothetical protein